MELSTCKSTLRDLRETFEGETFENPLKACEYTFLVRLDLAASDLHKKALFT